MFMADFFREIWRLYTLELPFLNNMTIGDFCIGFLVVLVSIKIYIHFSDGGNK